MRRELVLAAALITSLVGTQWLLMPVGRGAVPDTQRATSQPNDRERELTQLATKLEDELRERGDELSALQAQMKFRSESQAQECDAKLARLSVQVTNISSPAGSLGSHVSAFDSSSVITSSPTISWMNELKKHELIDAYDVWVLFRNDQAPTADMEHLRPFGAEDQTPFSCLAEQGVAVRAGVSVRPLLRDVFEDGHRVAGMIIGEPGMFPRIRFLIQQFQESNPHLILFVIDGGMSVDEAAEINLFARVKVFYGLDYVMKRFADSALGKEGSTCNTRVKEYIHLTNIQTDKDPPACSAQMDPPFIIPDRDHVTPLKPVIAMCILVYHTGDINNVNELGIVRRMFPHFLRTIRPSMGRFEFRMYIGLQPQPFFDDNHFGNVLLLRDTLNALAQEAGIVMQKIAFYRYPLNYGLTDIAFKWNALISDAYMDKADWFYQFSDDTELQTEGWADYFVDCLTSHGGLGTAGAIDGRNPKVLTLSFAGRRHLEIFGTYWPKEFKNWYSDNWAQFAYGPFLCTRGDVTMYNTQQNGQRYRECQHQLLYETLVHRAYYRIWRYVAHQPLLMQGVSSPIRPEDMLALTDAHEAQHTWPCLDRDLAAELFS